MLQIYCGEGKGKTTAAFGQGLRAAGRGKRVVVAQFLKSADSGERDAMEFVPRVLLLPVPDKLKFVFQMDAVERAECEYQCGKLLDDAAELAEQNGVVILDEVLDAIELELISLDDVTACLDALPDGCEAVLTGRRAPAELLERADYVTECVKKKHPFDKGTPAREGIEY
jgi:cob(I)alamin adenosyltransferase